MAGIVRGTVLQRERLNNWGLSSGPRPPSPTQKKASRYRTKCPENSCYHPDNRLHWNAAEAHISTSHMYRWWQYKDLPYILYTYLAFLIVWEPHATDQQERGLKTENTLFGVSSQTSGLRECNGCRFSLCYCRMLVRRELMVHTEPGELILSAFWKAPLHAPETQTLVISTIESNV